jgi:hypothetical protein
VSTPGDAVAANSGTEAERFEFCDEALRLRLIFYSLGPILPVFVLEILKIFQM